MILILEIINNTTVHLINETSNIVYGTFLVAGVAVGGALLKTGIAAIGIGKKKRVGYVNVCGT